MSRWKVNENIAALDCDGVVLDMDRCFAQVASDVLGRPIPKQSSAYAFTRRYGLTEAEFQRVWSALDDHEMGWSGLRVLPGAVEAIAKLKAHGMKVHLVTGIDDHLATCRLANLLSHGVEVDGIDCVGAGSASVQSRSKRDVLFRLAPCMFVDDRLSLVHEADFVPDRVWVDHGDEQDGHVVTEDIIRVRSLASWVDQWAVRHGNHRPTRHMRLVS